RGGIRNRSESSCPERGAFRDRHGRWGGMRWTRQCQKANDIEPAFVRASAERYQDRRVAFSKGGARTAKACGPDAPTLASSSRSHPLMTGAKEPGPRGEHEISC